MENNSEKEEENILDLDDIQVRFKGFDNSTIFLEALQASLPDFSEVLNIHKRLSEALLPQQELVKKFTESMPRFELPSMTILPALTRSPVIEVPSEPTKQKSVVTRKRPSKQKLQLGFYLLHGNSFEFKRKVLKSFSLDTQPGKLLHMFLHADGYFLGDDELLETFDKIMIRDFGFILRELKYSMKKNGLVITIDRRRKSKGYVLVDIAELQSTQI